MQTIRLNAPCLCVLLFSYVCPSCKVMLWAMHKFSYVTWASLLGSGICRPAAFDIVLAKSAAGCRGKTHCGCGSGNGVVDLQLGEQPLEGVIQGVHIPFLLLFLLVEQASNQQSAKANVCQSFLDSEKVIPVLIAFKGTQIAPRRLLFRHKSKDASHAHPHDQMCS